MKTNYQLISDEIIASLDHVPTMLLHCCCAPCSTYVLEYLSRYFRITAYAFNPNIYPEEEFYKRRDEQQRLISEMEFENPVGFIGEEIQSELFYDAVKGLENTGERGARCYECYRLRLSKTAETARAHGFEYFTTTLSISPLKNADWLNEIGKELEGDGLRYFYSDFKKRNGFKRSTELCRKYCIYRQNYCGCVFSMKEAEEREKARSQGENNA
ncbi:MAG: epoxyqueuosine reductase QueH [Oscillospiraceae bacterium]|nr:epoxyqueuosine reductase QueH [Oscillospiraceae bacterium]MCR5805462.1 epoxyqueuosine reductase QueH [Oscillospiraceae bacterium]